MRSVLTVKTGTVKANLSKEAELTILNGSCETLKKCDLKQKLTVTQLTKKRLTDYGHVTDCAIASFGD
jgi:hypothetical protein